MTKRLTEKQKEEIVNSFKYGIPIDVLSQKYNCTNSTITRNLNDACNKADAIVILTKWEDYLKINWLEISNLMRRPSWLFDTRGIVNEASLHDLHLNIWKIGKGFVKTI